VQRRNFVELIMKSSLVADSSFGTWPAPFCEFPSESRARRSGGQDITRREWSPGVRIGVGLTVMAVLMTFVGVTSLLQFGAFNPKLGAPTGPRTAEMAKASDEAFAPRTVQPAREGPVLSTEGDSK
jgi:hypothetical protein